MFYVLKAKFDVHSDVHISHILKSLNIKWRDHWQELWQLRNDGTRTRDELIAMVPVGINIDHWASFVDYRLNSKTKVYWNYFSSTSFKLMIINFYTLMSRSMLWKRKIIGQNKPLFTHVDLRVLQGKEMKWW